MTAGAARSSRAGRIRVDRSLLAVAILAIAARLAYVATSASDPLLTLRAIDETSYADLAHRFARGDVFFGEDTLWFAPLYPVALGTLEAAFGPGAIPAAVLGQHALGVFGALLALLAGRRLGSRGAGLYAGLALALLPTCIHAESRLLATGPTVYATAAFFFAFAGALRGGGARAAGVAGLVLGIGGLLRANVLAFVPVGAALLAFTGEPRAPRLRAAIAFVFGAAVTLVPVLLRNGFVAGEWTASTANAGMIFATAFAEDARGGRALERTPDDFGPGGAFHREAERATGRELTLGEAADYHAANAWGRIRGDPGWALRLVGRKLLLLLNAREIDDNLGFELARTRTPLLAWLPSPWAFVLVPAGVGAFAAAAGRDAAARNLRSPAAFAFVVGATLLVYFVTSRYRLPLVVPGALLAGFGIARLGEWRRARRPGPLAAAGVIAVALAGLALRDPGVEADPALTLVAIGAAFEARGDPASSLRATDEALRRNPALAGAWQNRALALSSLGREAEALESAGEALRLDPELAAAWMTRGALLARTGRVGEAVEPFRRAVALAPANPDALANLARSLAATGQLQEAVEVGRAALRHGAVDLRGELASWEESGEGGPKDPGGPPAQR